MTANWFPLSTNANVLCNVTSVLLVGVSVVFFIIGELGYLPQGDAVVALQWIYAANPPNDDNVDDNVCIDSLYFGLQSALFLCQKVGNSTTKITISYKSEDCAAGNNICSMCSGRGHASFALVLFASILAVWVLALVSARVDNVDKPPTVLCSGLSALCFAASLAAVLVFTGDCYNAIKDYYPEYQMVWGAGAALTITAAALMSIVGILQLMLVYCVYEEQAPYRPPSEPIIEIEIEIEMPSATVEKTEEVDEDFDEEGGK